MSELAGPNNIVACRLWLISDPISRSLLSTLTVIDSAKLIGLHCSRYPFGKIIYHFKTVAYAFHLNSFRWNFRRFDLEFWQKLYFWSDLRGVIENYRDRFYSWKSTKLRNLRLCLLWNSSTPLQNISSSASTTLEIIFGQRLSSFVVFCLITPELWNDLTCSQKSQEAISEVCGGCWSCPMLSLAKNGWKEIALWLGTFCPVVGTFRTNSDETRLILKLTDLNDRTYPKLIYKSSASSLMVAR